MLLVLIAACTGPKPQQDDSGTAPTEDSAPITETGTDTATNVTPVPCTAGGFAPGATQWALPSGLSDRAFAWHESSGNCEGLDWPRFETRDIDGDEVIDVVFTGACGDADVGTGTWTVHRGGSTGVAAGTAWALPTGWGEQAFPDASGGSLDCDGADSPAYTVTDLTGDGRPELVVTRDCEDASIGTSAWRVYVGTGTGFSLTASTWRLPEDYGEHGFDATSSTGSICADDVPSYVLADFTGDARPDLAVTLDCRDETVGSARWLLFPNSGSGFAPTATAFPLPSGYSAGAFQKHYSVATECAEGADVPAFRLLDGDGDGQVDLLVTSTCDGADVGTGVWHLHRNDGAGFLATGIPIPLPTGFAAESFASTYGTMDCSTSPGRPSFVLGDLTGDRIPDITMTALCDDPAVGSSTWRVYPGNGGGFLLPPFPWDLPVGYADSAFAATASAISSCDSGDYPAWFSTDATGDGVMDIVVTQDCEDSTVGTTNWSLFAGACTE